MSKKYGSTIYSISKEKASKNPNISKMHVTAYYRAIKPVCTYMFICLDRVFLIVTVDIMWCPKKIVNHAFCSALGSALLLACLGVHSKNKNIICCLVNKPLHSPDRLTRAS